MDAKIIAAVELLNAAAGIICAVHRRNSHRKEEIPDEGLESPATGA